MSRLKLFIFYPLVAIASTFLSADESGWRLTTIPPGVQWITKVGTAFYENNSIPITIMLRNTPTDKGGLSIVIHIDDMKKFNKFPFKDFEGPDSIGEEHKLFTIKITAGSDNKIFNYFSTGNYPPQNDQAYEFSTFIRKNDRKAFLVSLKSLIISGSGEIFIFIKQPGSISGMIKAKFEINGLRQFEKILLNNF